MPWTRSKAAVAGPIPSIVSRSSAPPAAAVAATARVSTVLRTWRGGGHKAARSSAPDTHNNEKKSPPMAIQNNSRQGETESKDSTLFLSRILCARESVGALHPAVHRGRRRRTRPPLYGTDRARRRRSPPPERR